MHKWCMCTCVWTCVHKGQRKMSGTWLYHSLAYSSEKVPQYLGWQSATLHDPPVSALKLLPYAQLPMALSMCAGIWSHIVIFAQQVLWHTETSISPAPISTHIFKWGGNGTELWVYREWGTSILLLWETVKKKLPRSHAPYSYSLLANAPVGQELPLLTRQPHVTTAHPVVSHHKYPATREKQNSRSL